MASTLTQHNDTIRVNQTKEHKQNTHKEFVQLRDTPEQTSPMRDSLRMDFTAALGKTNVTGFESIIQQLAVYKRKRLCDMTSFELESYHKAMEQRISKHLLSLRH